MPLITVTLPSDGDNANASTVDNPINAMLAVINGGLDSANFAAGGIANANLAAGAVTVDKLGANALTGWTPLSQSFAYGANNGQKEFTITTANDLSGVLSAGMRIKMTRGTTPPTQSMAFTSASSQYASNASPSGITFTGTFTLEAWIYPLSVGAQTIISRDNGSTAGWSMELDSAMRLNGFWRNATQNTAFNSYQSVPLNTWTHVAIVVTNIGAPAVSLYMNGVLVPSIITNSAATTLVQGGTLMIGNRSSSFFNGYISEARIWSTNQSTANIRANMAINLVGTETNLVGLWKGNGNFNDATSNANTLTAQAGAIATQATNPYNSVEYGIITKVAYVNPTTTITIFTGTDYNIPNMALSAINYSIVRAPYNFPTGRDKWRAEFLCNSNENVNFGAINTWTGSLGHIITVPTGAWRLSYQLVFHLNSTVSGIRNGGVGLFSAATQPPNTRTFGRLTAWMLVGTGADAQMTLYREDMVNLSATTNYTINGYISSATGSEVYKIRGDLGSTVMRAESAYV